MSAFDHLEARLLNMTLMDGLDKSPTRVTVGLFTSAPSEAHDGSYGLSGEPAAGGPYERAAVTMGEAAVVNGVTQSTNTAPVVISGLPPGAVYTHFALFDSPQPTTEEAG